MPFTLGPRLTAFLAEPLPLVLGSLLPANGGVHMFPTWYEFRDNRFWVNGLFLANLGPTGLWKANLQRNPSASLFIRDDAAPFRWVRIEARVQDSMTGPDDHLARLAQRYAGSLKPAPKVDPETFRLEPLRVAGGYDTGGPWD